MTSLHYLRDYFEQLDQDFHIKYSEVIHDYQLDSVHDLRVIIKKLKAFSEFLHYLNPDYNPDKFQNTLKVIHKKAGKVRDVQIEEQLIQKEVATHHIYTKLQKKLASLHKRVQAQYQEFEVGHCLIAVREDAAEVRVFIRQLKPKGLYKKILAYFLDRLELIGKQIKSKRTDYHEIRRNLKEILYNLQFLDSFPGSYQVDPEVTGELKQMESILGQWHDIYFTVHEMLEKEKMEKPLRKALKKDLKVATDQMKKSLEEFPALAKQLKKQLKPLLESIGEADRKNIHGSYTQENIGDSFR